MTDDVAISRLGAGAGGGTEDDVARVVAASDLFDGPATAEWAARFLRSDGHHILIAAVDGVDVGFVSGVETTHPDKGTEMFLYELGVDEGHRRRGIGRALVDALRDVAVGRGCHGMWVVTDADNAAAVATYLAAGSGPADPAITLTWNFGPGWDTPMLPAGPP